MLEPHAGHASRDPQETADPYRSVQGRGVRILIRDGVSRRSCDRHPDWPTLAQHLSEQFPEVSLERLVRELRAAKRAVEASELGTAEALATAELIARYQLLRIARRMGDQARLDPESHQRAGRGGAAGRR